MEGGHMHPSVQHKALARPAEAWQAGSPVRPRFISTARCCSKELSLGWNPAPTLTAVTMVSCEITQVSSTNHWGVTSHPYVWEVDSRETRYATGDQHPGSTPHRLTHLKMEDSEPPCIDGIPTEFYNLYWASVTEGVWQLSLRWVSLDACSQPKWEVKS